MCLSDWIEYSNITVPFPARCGLPCARKMLPHRSGPFLCMDIISLQKSIQSATPPHLDKLF